jgi:lactoylglutathione lyase
MELSQVRLLVDDFAGAFRFYRDELGLEVGSGDESSAYASFLGGKLAIFARAEQGNVVELRDAGDSTLTVLEVDDVDAAVAQLRARVVGEPQDQPEWGGRVAYLRDPSGNLLELFQVLEPQE